MNNEGIARMLTLTGAPPNVIWIGKEAAEQMGIVFLSDVPDGLWMRVSAKDGIVDEDGRTIGFRINPKQG